MVTRRPYPAVFERVERKDGTRWWLWVFVTADTVVFRMDPTRSAAVVEKHFDVDRETGALPEGRRLVLSSDFSTVYQSLARVEGVDPLWCWAHIRRYFVRAGDAHAQLAYWRDRWVERIGLLYLAHRDLAAAEPGTDPHRQAGEAFEAALADMDAARREQAALHNLHPAAKKVLATLDREWDGLVRHRDFPDLALDNNTVERALRNPVVGQHRKNYYGAQAAWAAHLAARVWTLTATAERNGYESPRLPDRIPERLRRSRGQVTRRHGTGTVLRLATRSRGHRRQPRPRRARALTPFDNRHAPDRQRRPGARRALPRHHRTLTASSLGGGEQSG